ncbi:hypothetical protein M422DRAFT_252770 [Sphaerobolus stellatus SS14]|uniref:Uncharacterized protein n=1 Tax=Sphaerobolus stellatus (strain SS14) TaxID=990650 RepID=A0A0C9VZ84_SPHS4|nr:hypothetical protein M422DRAFT_252770 [Sphaerobolus stellatus SS14]
MAMSTAITSAACQIFYIHRCWALSHNWLFVLAASLVLAGSIGTSVAVTWATVELVKSLTDITMNWKRLMHVTNIIVLTQRAYYACTLACDVLITIFTCYYLLPKKSRFDQTNTTNSRQISSVSGNSIRR